MLSEDVQLPDLWKESFSGIGLSRFLIRPIIKINEIIFQKNNFIVFQIMIKIERGKSHRGDIAIDDVSFGTGCLPVQGRLSICKGKHFVCQTFYKPSFPLRVSMLL